MYNSYNNFIAEALFDVGDMVATDLFGGIIGVITIVNASTPNIFYGIDSVASYIPQKDLYLIKQN